MREPDEWLMQQVTLGSAAHLDVLVRRHASPILTFTTRLLGSASRGEEAFQDTFLSIWSRRNTYRYPSPFRPWLFRIAHNKCREISRGRDFLALRYNDEPAPDSLNSAHHPSIPGPADIAIALETTLIVESAVAQLPEQQRATLIMRVWNNMSYSEIAEALAIAEPTARSAMHYALQSMRRILEPRLREPKESA
jgi:RNA polymerase sigma-70 factor (ECF subfamily)